jgi:hypothetical protein
MVAPAADGTAVMRGIQLALKPLVNVVDLRKFIIN